MNPTKVTQMSKFFTLVLIFFASYTFAQHTTIDYDSESNGQPHLLLEEDDSVGEEMARIWFRNKAEPENWWTVGARAKSGSMDFDNTLEQNFTIGFQGQQKLAISKNGEVRINTAYILPTSDGTNGQVLTTDGNGQTSWSNVPTSSSSVSSASIQDFMQLKPMFKNPGCPTDGSLNGKVIFSGKAKKLKVCIDGSWTNLH